MGKKGSWQGKATEKYSVLSFMVVDRRKGYIK